MQHFPKDRLTPGRPRSFYTAAIHHHHPSLRLYLSCCTKYPFLYHITSQHITAHHITLPILLPLTPVRTKHVNQPSAAPMTQSPRTAKSNAIRTYITSKPSLPSHPRVRAGDSSPEATLSTGNFPAPRHTHASLQPTSSRPPLVRPSPCLALPCPDPQDPIGRGTHMPCHVFEKCAEPPTITPRLPLHPIRVYIIPS